MTNLLEAATKRLQQQADTMPCACIPYRGGKTGAYHWSTCPWDSWMDGFHAGLAAMGLDVDTLPDLPIGAKEKR